VAIIFSWFLFKIKDYLVPRRSLHNHLHGFAVISLDFQVGHPAVTLAGSDGVVPQQVLDGGEIGIGMEHLRGHGMTQMMTQGQGVHKCGADRLQFPPLSGRVEG
jgi:hypothetical protein